MNNAMHGSFHNGVLARMLGALLLGALLFAAGAGSIRAAVAPGEELIRVEVGTHQLVRESTSIRRVAVGSPGIADVNVINGREMLIVGKQKGVTSLLVWTRSTGEPKRFRIRVGDVTDPDRPVTTDPELAGTTIAPGARLEGKLPNLLAYRRAKATAAAGEGVNDQSVVEGDFQVMTQIKIAEVNRTTLQSYGAQFFKNVANTTAGLGTPGLLSGITGGNANGGFGLSSNSGFLPVQDAFSLVFGDATRGFLGVISVLENKGLARVLAEPSLTAMSGQTATFLAGGEFPVPVNQSGSGAGGGSAITVEFKEFGVRLALTPTVLSKDRIALKVAPEVSDLDFTSGVQVGGVAVPALTVRRTETTIELGDGESFVISGLVSNNLIANVDKVPWLGELPILGAFFKSVSNERSEQELIMVVTPRLVRPLAREAALPKLPGEEYDRYRPGFGKIMFEENGQFDADSSLFGFSD